MRDVTSVAMRLSLLTAVLMLVGKLGAWFITGSTAILSDAAESVVHIFATGVAALSLWYARQPADQNHPYGHGKIAYFSVGFEGAFILVAAVYIVYEGARALILGPELQQLDLGLLITLSLALVNAALGFFLVYQGNRHNAMILVANGKHVLTDMWTSVGVVVGVGLVWATDLLWLDPVVAIIVGLNILYTAAGLIYRGVHGLLDAADPHQTRELVARLDQAKADGEIIDFHQLRYRRSDNVMWIEVHVLMPEQMAVRDAHARISRVEEALRALFPESRVHVTTHMEPDPHELAHPAGHTAPDPLSPAQAHPD